MVSQRVCAFIARPLRAGVSLARSSRFDISALALGALIFSVQSTNLQPHSEAPQIAAFLQDAPEDGVLALYRAGREAWPAITLDPLSRSSDLLPFTDFVSLKKDSRDLALNFLGSSLFADPILSKSGHFSCESCHNRALGWSDGVPRSIGHGRTEGKRNAPSIAAAASQPVLFWDGRAANLHEQARASMLDPAELANDSIEEVVARVQADPDYPARFAMLFPQMLTAPEADPKAAVTIETITTALAAFQRGQARRSRFDRFMAGDDDALHDAEIRGLHLFRTKARCINCHGGSLMADGQFHNIGLGFPTTRLRDLGRYGVTGDARDAGKFRTASLRLVGSSAPYMHNGVFPNLEGVVRFYAGGGGKPGASDKQPAVDPVEINIRAVSPLLQRLDLGDQDIADLVAFLKTL